MLFIAQRSCFMLSESTKIVKSLKIFNILLILLMLHVKVNASDNPIIEFTYVPPCGSFENLEGQVSNVTPGDYKVAVYIRVDGGWWNKPTWANPLTPIQSDGSWSCDITTGGHDQDATEIIAYLVPNGYTPPQMSGQCALPAELDENSVAKVKTMRSCDSRMIIFAGYNWIVKSSTSKVGPGPNYFSDSEENVWVDPNGRLHLKITPRDCKWYCAEVILEDSFGYGEYIFHLASRADQLNENIVLGLFTWDNCPDPTYGNREIDIEFSRWGEVENDNAQFVVQPYYNPGNMHRFNMQQDEDESTHSFTWLENSIRFQSIYDDSAELWTYTGEDIPQPGDENARINLWLFSGQSPSDGKEAEIVIENFEYIPPYSPGDVSGDGKITAYDASLVLQYVVGLTDFEIAKVKAADVTGDSVVTALDAALILQYTVGLITQFPGGFTGAPILTAKDGNQLLTKIIDELENVSLTTEQKHILKQLKQLIWQRLLPSYTTLLQNYPNPFNPETWIPYQLATDLHVTISIYSAKGQLVRTISLGNQNAGVYITKDQAAYWDSRDSLGEKVASGMYYYTLKVGEVIPRIGAGEFRDTRKMVILK